MTTKTMMGVVRTSLLGLCALSAAWAQKPDAGRYSEATYKVKVTVGVMVAMRDGVRLSVDLYQPDAPGKFPVILTHIPYDNQRPVAWYGPARAKWFAQRGYVFAMSDFRGRYDSEGVYDMFDAKHKTDGYDLVEWLARQPWSTGKVGMTGPSYMGWSQWWAARPGAPFLEGHRAGGSTAGPVLQRPLSKRHPGLLGDGLGRWNDGGTHEPDNRRRSIWRMVRITA